MDGEVATELGDRVRVLGHHRCDAVSLILSPKIQKPGGLPGFWVATLACPGHEVFPGWGPSVSVFIAWLWGVSTTP